MNACDIVYSNYLSHFGILGMKWGIRRYQNKDGTLTEAGKKRYSVNRASQFNEAVNKQLASKRAQREFRKLVDNGSQESQLLKTKNAQLAKDQEELNKAFDKYYSIYAKKHGEWTGDGTEAHWLLEKEFPEYKKLSEKEMNSSKEYAQTLLALSGKGYFDKVFSKMPDFLDKYKDWYIRQDGKASAAVASFIRQFGGAEFFGENVTTWAVDGDKEEKLRYYYD